MTVGSLSKVLLRAVDVVEADPVFGASQRPRGGSKSRRDPPYSIGAILTSPGAKHELGWRVITSTGMPKATGAFHDTSAGNAVLSSVRVVMKRSDKYAPDVDISWTEGMPPLAQIGRHVLDTAREGGKLVYPEAVLHVYRDIFDVSKALSLQFQVAKIASEPPGSSWIVEALEPVKVEERGSYDVDYERSTRNASMGEYEPSKPHVGMRNVLKVPGRTAPTTKPSECYSVLRRVLARVVDTSAKHISFLKIDETNASPGQVSDAMKGLTIRDDIARFLSGKGTDPRAVAKITAFGEFLREGHEKTASGDPPRKLDTPPFDSFYAKIVLSADMTVIMSAQNVCLRSLPGGGVAFPTVVYTVIRPPGKGVDDTDVPGLSRDWKKLASAAVASVCRRLSKRGHSKDAPVPGTLDSVPIGLPGIPSAPRLDSRDGTSISDIETVPGGDLGMPGGGGSKAVVPPRRMVRSKLAGPKRPA